MPKKNLPSSRTFIICCIMLILVALTACTNMISTENVAKRLNTERNDCEVSASAMPTTTVRDNTTTLCLSSIDQLQTFYDEKGIPFRVLITHEMVDGISVMGISILDNLNTPLMEVDSYKSAPCIYYESFINMDYVDMNADGKGDIVITANYMTGVGATGAVPQGYRITYLQLEGEYFADENIVPVETEGTVLLS